MCWVSMKNYYLITGIDARCYVVLAETAWQAAKLVEFEWATVVAVKRVTDTVAHRAFRKKHTMQRCLSVD